jgi:hypothetical protein
MTTEPHGWDETDAPEAVGDALAGLGWTVAGLESAVERLQRAGRRVTQVLILGAGAQLVGSAALLIVWLLWRGARECIERPGWVAERSERFLPRVATGICLGYRDQWIATRFNLTVAQVKAAKARDDFQTSLDEAEIEHQIQMRGRQRRVARLTLKALERRLQADDLIIVTLGIEKVLRLGTLGLLPNEDDDEGAPPTPASPVARLCRGACRCRSRAPRAGTATGVTPRPSRRPLAPHRRALTHARRGPRGVPAPGGAPRPRP